MQAHKCFENQNCMWCPTKMQGSEPLCKSGKKPAVPIPNEEIIYDQMGH